MVIRACILLLRYLGVFFCAVWSEWMTVWSVLHISCFQIVVWKDFSRCMVWVTDSVNMLSCRLICFGGSCQLNLLSWKGNTVIYYPYPMVIPLIFGGAWVTDEAFKIAVSFLVSHVSCFIIPVFLYFPLSFFPLPFPAPQSHPHRYHASVNPVLCNNSEDRIT